MSVLASQRKTGDLTVIIKAKENAIYTLKVTHNEKRFPKRYRFSVTNKLQDLAIDILTNLIQANEIFPRTTEEYQHRLFFAAESNGIMSGVEYIDRCSVGVLFNRKENGRLLGKKCDRNKKHDCILDEQRQEQVQRPL